ncbi:MAG: N-formylglutamate deformylase [Pseudomonadota bacterium]
MSFVSVERGGSPLVLGLPHTGTTLPDQVRDRLNDRGRALADTDWHIDRLYDGIVCDVTTVRTEVHRYAIDVNRDPGGVSLYPGQATTGLCPVTDFDGQPIYRDARTPDAAEIARRLELWHAPYHTALCAEMARIRDVHGFAVLYDCHSIRSVIPRLFAGTLSDFNIGTNGGATCAAGVETILGDACQAADGYTSVINGRFRGGWTTRHYGRPADGWHAIQMELAQSTYLSAEAPPWRFDETRAARLREVLKDSLTKLRDWRPE